MVTWEIKGREFGNCNCNYGCPCQFNALPTHGHCRGLAVFDIEQGFHGTTRLDGLRSAGIFRWPGPIHEGKGEGWHIVDRRATPKQREALLRILRGADTEPGATVYQVFSSTCDTFHEHAVADIDFELDIEGRKARAKIENLVEMRGEPILTRSPAGSTAYASCSRTASSSRRRRSAAAGPKSLGPSASRLKTPTGNLPTCIFAKAAWCAERDRRDGLLSRC
jgi:hypothetical protein